MSYRIMQPYRNLLIEALIYNCYATRDGADSINHEIPPDCPDWAKRAIKLIESDTYRIGKKVRIDSVTSCGGEEGIIDNIRIEDSIEIITVKFPDGHTEEYHSGLVYLIS